MAQVELLHAIERHVVEAFGPTIQDLNTFLIDRGVLPKLRRSYSASAADKKQSIEAERLATLPTYLLCCKNSSRRSRPMGARVPSACQWSAAMATQPQACIVREVCLATWPCRWSRS